MLTVQEALIRATGQLAANPYLAPTALPDATLLLLHTLKLDRAALIAHPERRVGRDEQARYQDLLTRRLAFEPIQYILGTQEFFGLELEVTPAVLIPRPETELLVEAVLARLPRAADVRLADVGTGSGAIALALAANLPNVEVTAIDISPAALAVARRNAARHDLAERVLFIEGDLLSGFEGQVHFDVVVANPPYIPETERATLHPQVREHEPAQALFAGPNGMDAYERLLPQARAVLSPGGLLAMEMGHGQQPELSDLLGQWQRVEYLRDLQGIYRVALAWR